MTELAALLKEGRRIDELHHNGYRIIQNENCSVSGWTVLLSGFTNVKEDECALDVGTGTGIIPILLAAKTKGTHFTGLEISETSADMARRSAELNDLSQRLDIVRGDIKGRRCFAPASLMSSSNPPYMIGHGLVSGYRKGGGTP